MENFYLSPGESIYFGGSIAPQVTIKKESAPEPVKLRPAKRKGYHGGRRSLTPEQIAARDEYQQELARAGRAEREKARAAKRAEKERLNRQKSARSEQLKKAAAEREAVQAMKNRREVPVLVNEECKPQIAGEISKSGARSSVGAPPLKDKKAVRIDNKTVIYIDIGKDTDAAIAAFKRRYGCRL